MGKEYRYRKHIHWGRYVILGVCGIGLLLMLGFIVILAREAAMTCLTGLFAVLGLVILIEGIAGWTIYFRLAGTVVSLTEEALIYKNRGVEKRFPLESLYLEFASIKYTGGWLKIKSGGETIRLTVVLEDISGFVQELKARLDGKQLSSHYDAHKLFGFLKTAAASDQSWERLYGLFGKLVLLMLDLGIAIFAGYEFGTIRLYGVLLASSWVAASILWVTIAYTIAEIILMRQIARQSNEAAFTFPARDPAYEKLVFDRAFLWGGLTYLLFSLAIVVVVISVKLI